MNLDLALLPTRMQQYLEISKNRHQFFGYLMGALSGLHPHHFHFPLNCHARLPRRDGIGEGDSRGAR